MQGRLFQTRLEDTPEYSALSYVWGGASPSDPMLQVNCSQLKIRRSLFQALEQILSHVTTMVLWIDQICIDQENDVEREQQVKLMSGIFIQAQRVICWLGIHEKDSDYAFDLLHALVPNTTDPKASMDWKKSTDKLLAAGFLNDLFDLFDPSKIPFAAVAALANRPWFSRLWIVQEVALASELEFRCGGSTIRGTTFFTAMQALSSGVHDPPAPWLLKPFRHAIILDQLRAKTLSTWDCKKSHDRLNALFGLVARNSPVHTWFLPSYSITSPELYSTFAKGYIQQRRNLDILHFAGCGDVGAYSLSKAYDSVIVELGRPADDVPSWVPDWRVQSRPITLLPDVTAGDNSGAQFLATVSSADYYLNEASQTLRVRALLVDEITHVQITEHDIFGLWFNLAKDTIECDGFESMFASTLVMGAKVTPTENGALNVQPEEVLDIFRHWAERNLNETRTRSIEDSYDLSEGSARFGYLAEEVCRNRTLFVTKSGRLGLGSTHVSPGASIYLIHGLKTPFVVHTTSDEQHILRGECYVHGLMDQQASTSDLDVYLNFT
ncbi:heterokaryon incompatibility protein-domain-containing protein [Dactylonectria macrodidyma]|uniref:Heterokaryon incompatibility protein-domain-containing protein n=1 Tax=Dactylonectria macrodidyma TaxID=307937 RepID=A0A9P9EER5_9HYPO|nr:heterokaryon incompatibility protein-domain-containing protein [Dactylonectria macrodidyma]